MAVTLAKSKDEIQQAPLVELAFEILKVTKEPAYFRDLMKEIQQLRGMSDDEVTQIIARLYTELNIDGRFVCIGQNMWGLKRWYPADKTAEKAISGKKGFVRKSGDAFSDDDEEDFDAGLDDDEDLDDDEIVDNEEPVTDTADDSDEELDGEDAADSEDFEDENLSEDGEEEESFDEDEDEHADEEEY